VAGFAVLPLALFCALGLAWYVLDASGAGLALYSHEVTADRQSLRGSVVRVNVVGNYVGAYCVFAQNSLTKV
jgi:hypothetical protein